MKPKRPRIVAYLQPETDKTLRVMARQQGKSISQVIDEAISKAHVDRFEWMCLQAGHLSLWSMSLLINIAQKTLSPEQLSGCKKDAAQAVGVIFGALPPRPFTPTTDRPEDERMAALYEALRR